MAKSGMVIEYPKKSPMPEPEVTCHHDRTREIGQDFDKDGKLVRLIRCRECGLLMREYLQTL